MQRKSLPADLARAFVSEQSQILGQKEIST
jgi:hypothetical protein